MALSFVGAGTPIEATLTDPAAGTFGLYPFSPFNDPPGGIQVGQQLFIVAATTHDPGTGDVIDVLTPSGWTGGGLSFSSGGQRFSLAFFARVANGTSSDRPTVNVQRGVNTVPTDFAGQAFMVALDGGTYTEDFDEFFSANGAAPLPSATSTTTTGDALILTIAIDASLTAAPTFGTANSHSIGLAATPSTPTVPPVSFGYRIVTAAGSYPRARWTGAGIIGARGGTFNAVLDVDPEPPIAVIEASTLFVNPGGSVTFYGTDSYDLDGSIVSYAWSIEQPSPAAALTDTADTTTASFSQTGSYDATLIVTDNDGLTDTTSVTVVVAYATVTEAHASQPIIIRQT